MVGCHWMMKSILDDLRPKLWHKFDMTASCIRNLFHQDRRWMENSIATFWGDWGTTSVAYVQTNGATTPGPGIMTTLWLTRRLLYSSFWLLRIRVIPHPSYSPDLAPCDFFLFKKWNWKSRGDVLTALKRSRSNCGACWRRWREMTFRSASDHGSPTGICINAKGYYFKGSGGE
jgi:hypothetical protein